MTGLPSALEAARQVMQGYERPWAVAGGWALELALGPLSRSHADLDLAILRDDQQVLRARLSAWGWSCVEAGQRRPWRSAEWLASPIHELHAAPPLRGRPGFEFLLNEREGADWVFRREARVRMPLAQATQESPSRLPVLAPEIVLLYKAKTPRPQDQSDFRATAPLLAPLAQRWLAAALSLCHPGHPWERELAMREA